MSTTEQRRQTEADYPEHGSELFYELAKDRLSTQLQTVDGLDAKLGMLFSASSALIGILVAVFTIKSLFATPTTPKTVAQPLTGGDYTVIAISGLLYLVAGYFTWRSFRTRTWKTGPKLQAVWDDLDTEPSDTLVRWKAGRAFWSAYDKNIPAVEEKADRLPIVVALIILQVLALCAALGLVAAGG